MSMLTAASSQNASGAEYVTNVATSRSIHRGRRSITREQGRALETLGHAFDYLNDKYACQGDDEEIINVRGPHTEALQILILAHREFMWSVPVRETLSARMWKTVFRRKDRSESAPMVTLTSSQ